jgi:ABC-2 type transport system permease protein/oleandomycin transport system permease protein
MPLAFVLGLNAAFGGLVTLATGGSYIQYLLPGVIVMNVLLGASVTSFGLAEDLQAGIVDRFRSLPMSRAAVLVGRTIADLARYAVGLAVTLAVGVALGFRVHGGVAAALGGIVLVLAFEFAISWFFACLGMAVKEPQAAQMAGFLPALPLIYLSGAWVPVASMSAALRPFARNQPVNVVVETVRAIADGTAVAHSAVPAVLWTAGILAVSVPLGLRLYRADGA